MFFQYSIFYTMNHVFINMHRTFLSLLSFLPFSSLPFSFVLLCSTLACVICTAFNCHSPPIIPLFPHPSSPLLSVPFPLFLPLPPFLPLPFPSYLLFPPFLAFLSSPLPLSFPSFLLLLPLVPFLPLPLPILLLLPSLSLPSDSFPSCQSYNFKNILNCCCTLFYYSFTNIDPFTERDTPCSTCRESLAHKTEKRPTRPPRKHELNK